LTTGVEVEFKQLFGKIDHKQLLGIRIEGGQIDEVFCHFFSDDTLRIYVQINIYSISMSSRMLIEGDNWFEACESVLAVEIQAKLNRGQNLTFSLIKEMMMNILNTTIHGKIFLMTAKEPLSKTWGMDFLKCHHFHNAEISVTNNDKKAVESLPNSADSKYIAPNKTQQCDIYKGNEANRMKCIDIIQNARKFVHQIRKEEGGKCAKNNTVNDNSGSHAGDSDSSNSDSDSDSDSGNNKQTPQQGDYYYGPPPQPAPDSNNTPTTCSIIRPDSDYLVRQYAMGSFERILPNWRDEKGKVVPQTSRKGSLYFRTRAASLPECVLSVPDQSCNCNTSISKDDNEFYETIYLVDRSNCTNTQTKKVKQYRKYWDGMEVAALNVLWRCGYDVERASQEMQCTMEEYGFSAPDKIFDDHWLTEARDEPDLNPSPKCPADRKNYRLWDIHASYFTFPVTKKKNKRVTKYDKIWKVTGKGVKHPFEREFLW